MNILFNFLNLLQCFGCGYSNCMINDVIPLDDMPMIPSTKF